MDKKAVLIGSIIYASVLNMSMKKMYIMFGIAPLLAITIIVTLKMVEYQTMQVKTGEDEFVGVERIMPEITTKKVENDNTINFILPYITSLITATIIVVIIKRLS